MKNGINFLPLMIFLCVTLAFLSSEANAQPTYLPVGPQTDVPVATVTGGGWTECYRDFYANFMDASVVLSDCPGDLLMLSCRNPKSSTLTLLAQGNRRLGCVLEEEGLTATCAPDAQAQLLRLEAAIHVVV